MRERVREFVVIAVKTGVSAVVAWLAVRQIDIPEDIRTTLEAGLTGLGVGVVNWVLNYVAGWLAKIPVVGSAVAIVWPTPSYDQTPVAVVSVQSEAPTSGYDPV